MSSIDLFFFGSPRFTRHEKAASLHRRRRSIALLAYLALTAQPQSRERLATLLWPEHEPDQGRSNLRRDLSYLKNQLGKELILADREQIEINSAAALWVDVRQFKEKITAVQQHHNPGELPCAACVATLKEAVALYEDDFMAGYTLPDGGEFEEWQFFQRESLQQLLALSLQQLITWHEAADTLEEAVPYGRRWVALDPLHEPAQRSLIKLYAGSGQEAAARRQYEQLQHLLQTELGLEPEPETAALYTAVKTKQFSRAATTKPRSDTHGQPAPELPVPATPFIGRAREIEAVTRLLRGSKDGRLYTITGPGGIGKTRLALQVAATLAGNYAAVYFVSLTAVSTTEGIISAIAENANCRFFGADEPREQLFAFLRYKKVLLVLDNFEHLLDEAPLLVDLLHTADQLTLLVTSRERLNLSEEIVYPLVGLSLPESSSALETSDAVELLKQRARMARRDITFSGEDEAALVQICRLVQGMPLAIVLAASWLDMLSFEEIITEINRSLDFLAAKMRDIPPRQQSVRAVFEASWQQLSSEEQAMFMKLSVFYGDFTREAAQAVTGQGLHQLRQLINKSIVTAVPNQRYQLHELLRQFAAGQLASSPDQVVEANDNHYAWFAAFIHEQSERLMGGQQRQALAAITADLDNIRAAWEWGVEHGKLAELQLILLPLQLTFQFRSRYVEGVSLWEKARLKIEKLPPSTERDRVLEEMMVYWSWLLIRLGRLEQAETLLQECRTSYSQEAASAIAGYGADPLIPLSLIATIRGDYETAVTYGQQSVAANQTESQIRNRYNAYYVLTSATVSQGDYTAALKYARQAYELINQVDDRWYMAYILIEMGKIALAIGDIDQAQEHFSTSYKLRQIFEDPEGQAIALTHLGQVMIQKTNFAEAKACYQESFSLYQEINDKGGLVRVYHGLGQIATFQGEFQNARYYLRQAFTTAVEMDFIPLLFPILNSIGKLLVELDRPARALTLFLFIDQHPACDLSSQAEAAVYIQKLSSDHHPEELAGLSNLVYPNEQPLSQMLINTLFSS